MNIEIKLDVIMWQGPIYYYDGKEFRIVPGQNLEAIEKRNQKLMREGLEKAVDAIKQEIFLAEVKEILK